MLGKKEFRCYDMNIEESEKVGSFQELNPGQLKLPVITITILYNIMVSGCLAVVAQWQSSGGSSQWCLGFDYWRLLAFSIYI